MKANRERLGSPYPAELSAEARADLWQFLSQVARRQDSAKTTSLIAKGER